MPDTVKKGISIKQSLKKFTIFLERKRKIRDKKQNKLAIKKKKKMPEWVI